MDDILEWWKRCIISLLEANWLYLSMSRPIEGNPLHLRGFWYLESMKFSLQSVKISTQIRKKMAESTYLDNANLTSVTHTPKSHRT